MTNTLILNASIQGDTSNSTLLTSYYHSLLPANVKVNTRNLLPNEIPALTANDLQAWGTSPEARSEAQLQQVSLSDELINEVQQADTLVIGLPMYNFGAPSSLKAWIDHIARAGVTFRYTDTGPEGLLKGKRAHVFITSGGKYAGTPMDSLSPWITTVLKFLGFSEVSVIFAEGLAMGDAQTVLDGAKANIATLLKNAA